MSIEVKKLKDRTEYYKDGNLHREGDLPAIEWANGTMAWYQKGLRHRETGPAIEWSDGSKEWWVNGLCHREGGPAIEWANGDRSWYINGLELTEEEFDKRYGFGVYDYAMGLL